MLIYFLIILAIIYIYTIIRCFLKIKEIDMLIDVLEKYLDSVKNNSHRDISFNDDYVDSLSLLLHHYPKIVNCLGFYIPDLEYGADAKETYKNAFCIYNDLLMSRNYAVDRFLNSFNPSISIKKFLRIPSTLLKWMGFNFDSDFIKIINLLGWLLAYFLNLYAPEIKTLISTFFKN